MIYTFGDSFTDFYPNRESLNWAKLLSDKLNLDLNNKGLVGCSNSYIIKSLISELIKIKTNDYIIIQISGPGRMDVPVSENEISTVYASDMGVYNEEIKNNKGYIWNYNDWKTIEDYFTKFHSIGYQYKTDVDLILNLANFIYRKITKNIILWNICAIGGYVESHYNDDINKTYNPQKHDSDLWLDDPNTGWIERIDLAGKSIYKKTNKKIKDYHLSEDGHIWLSEIIFNKFML